MKKAAKKKVQSPEIQVVYAPKPGHVEIPLAKVLALVFNMMDGEADKRVGPEILAEYTGRLTQNDIEDFVMQTVRNLPGYNLRDGLRIADALTKWRKQYFDDAFEGSHS